jgi:predicted NBD/HSP70 family sugar kinase
MHRDLLKAINRSLILNVIKAHGAIARADIARLTGLSPAAVTQQTGQLIRDGLVVEKEAGDSRGGRRPILLALNASGIYVLGIKLAEEHATLALTDVNADILARYTIQLGERDPISVSDQLAVGANVLLNETGVDAGHILGVGVGLAGIIDAVNGICQISPFNGWRDVPFARLLEDRLGCPAYLDNNVNTLTLVERLYGPGQHVKNFIIVTIGYGVGMGMVINGQIFRGDAGYGGEFGHIVVDPDGEVCRCGKRGCLETFAADPWLVKHAVSNGLAIANIAELLAAAQAGNAVALRAFERAGRILGQGIANLISVLNPALLILSGEGIRAGEYVFPAMHAAIQQHTFGRLDERVQVRVEPLSDDTWARGAASLVLNQIFNTPPVSVPAGG